MKRAEFTGMAGKVVADFHTERLREEGWGAARTLLLCNPFAKPGDAIVYAVRLHKGLMLWLFSDGTVRDFRSNRIIKKPFTTLLTSKRGTP